LTVTNQISFFNQILERLIAPMKQSFSLLPLSSRPMFPPLCRTGTISKGPSEFFPEPLPFPLRSSTSSSFFLYRRLSFFISTQLFDGGHNGNVDSPRLFPSQLRKLASLIRNFFLLQISTLRPSVVVGTPFTVFLDHSGLLSYLRVFYPLSLFVF